MALKISRKKRTIKLTSGVIAEVAGFIGKNQRTLTQKGKKHHEKMNELLADVLVSVEGIDFSGMQPYQKERFVEQMLSADRRQILSVARQIAQGQDPTIVYAHEYKTSSGVKKVEKMNITLIDEESRKEIVENILSYFNESEADKWEPIIKELNKVGDFPTRPYLNQYSDYNEVLENKTVDFEGVEQLEGYLMQFDLLTGELEKTLDTKNLNSHAIFQIRNLRYQDPETKTWFKVQQSDLDKLSPLTLSKIKEVFENYEGDLDTVEIIPNPDESAEEEELKIDLMAQIGFFFPSGQI